MMKSVSSIPLLRRLVSAHRAQGKTIGFVPTMGAFHDGHLSLIRACRKEHDIVIVSIFVNPIQFGPKEDFKAYPRNKRRDCRLAREAGCNILFYPSVKAMYPRIPVTLIDVPGVSEGLCGARRPGHFQGVATVVAKLFHIVDPDAAYFGQKDFQQAAVIRRMVEDLNMPIRIRTIPTVREHDGLAMSSRNVYLTEVQRREAPVIFEALKEARRAVRAGERRPSAVKAFVRSRISRTSGIVDYIECRDAATLAPVKELRGKCVIAAAVFFGTARLIDNIILQI